MQKRSAFLKWSEIVDDVSYSFNRVKKPDKSSNAASENFNTKFPRGFHSLMDAIENKKTICDDSLKVETKDETKSVEEKVRTIAVIDLVRSGIPYFRHLLYPFEIQLQSISVLNSLGIENDTEQSFNPMKLKFTSATYNPLQRTSEKSKTFKTDENSFSGVPKTAASASLKFRSFKDVSAKLQEAASEKPQETPPEKKVDIEKMVTPEKPVLEQSKIDNVVKGSSPIKSEESNVKQSPHKCLSRSSKRPKIKLPVNKTALDFRIRQIALVKSSREYQLYIKYQSDDDNKTRLETPRAHTRESASKFLKSLRDWKSEIRLKLQNYGDFDPEDKPVRLSLTE